jgi:hypothetical protein
MTSTGHGLAVISPPPIIAAAADPRRRLAIHAMWLVRLDLSGRRPARWGQPGFARQVELVRRHLAPIHHRVLLAASFGREGFQARDAIEDVVRDLATSPTAVAYAIRWLELGDGRIRPGWTADSERPARRTSRAGTATKRPIRCPCDTSSR